MRRHALLALVLAAAMAIVSPATGLGAEAPAARAYAASPAAADVACPPAESPGALEDGAAVTGSVGADGLCYYAFTPVAGKSFTRVALTNVADDFDVYVRRGAQPTIAVYECRPFETGAVEETCEVENDGRTVHVMIDAFSAAGGSFTVTASGVDVEYCDRVETTTPIEFGATTHGLMGADDSAMCFYAFTADGSTDSLRVSLDPASGNLDVFVRAHKRPTLSVYDCESSAFGAGAVEACSVPSFAGDRYYVMVFNRGGGGAFTLSTRSVRACSLGADDVPLAVGGSVSGELGPIEDATCYFTVVADGASDALEVRMTPAAGDSDLLARAGARPYGGDYDCLSASPGLEEETCILPNVAGTTHHLAVTSFDDARGFEVAARRMDFPEVPSGGALEGSVAPDDVAYFKVVVPEGVTALAVTLRHAPGGIAHADLYVSRDAFPEIGDAECEAATTRPVETCNWIAPAPGTYFGLVFGRQGTTSYAVSALRA